MKWIKALERLPEDGKLVEIKTDTTRATYARWSKDNNAFVNIIGVRYPPTLYFIEWLDESPPLVQSDSDLDDIISKYVGNPSRLLRIDVEKTAIEYASLKTKELREALDDCDFLLAYFEDFTHGKDGDEITQCRGKINKALKK